MKTSCSLSEKPHSPAKGSELDGHTGKAVRACLPMELQPPLWVTIVKPWSSPDLDGIVSQGLLPGNPGKPIGKINTVSLSL